MAVALGGMSTAFYTTLFGAVLGGVFLRLLTLFSDRMADDAVCALSHFCDVVIEPQFNQTAEREFARLHKDARDVAQEIRHLMGQLSRVGDNIVQQHGNAATVLAQQYGTLGDQVLAINNMIKESAKAHQADTRVARATLKELTVTIQSLKTSTSSLVRATSKVVKAMEVVEKTAQQSTKEFVAHSDKLFKRLESRAVVTALRDLGKKFDSANTRRRSSE